MRQIAVLIRADDKYCQVPNTEADCGNIATNWKDDLTCQEFYDELKKDGDKVLRCDKCLRADRGEVWRGC
jgi:hypothetical protein